jgi:hypothetical protein
MTLSCGPEASGRARAAERSHVSDGLGGQRLRPAVWEVVGILRDG